MMPLRFMTALTPKIIIFLFLIINVQRQVLALARPFVLNRYCEGYVSTSHPRTKLSILHEAPLSTVNLNRGSSYGMDNNCTIPTAAQVAAMVGVKPPAEVSARHWKRAWMVQKYFTPMLHLLDQEKPPNSSLNLYCLWWKALAGNDEDSPCFDNSLSFDILPRGTRWIVAHPQWFPRLHHANIEIRTAFLDRSVTNFAKAIHPHQNVRLISMGSGYDVRSIKLKERQVIDQAIELDLPEVVHAKQKIFASKRFRQRRPNIVDEVLPMFYPVDLNDVATVKQILLDVLHSQTNVDGGKGWYTIFLFEAVMIYLDENVPKLLLKVCSDVLKSTGNQGSLVFADRLENVPQGDENVGVQELAAQGWRVCEWLPKPGLARHMGSAVLLE